MLMAKQHSAFSMFAYDLFENDEVVGTLRWPDFAEAKNARLKNPLPGLLRKDIEILYREQKYVITFEYLTRDWNNDVRFTLEGGEGVLAVADVVKQKELAKGFAINITQPFVGRLERRNTFMQKRYEVIANEVVLGTIAEKSAVMVKRKLEVNLPDSVAVATQIFLLFLCCNDAYR